MMNHEKLDCYQRSLTQREIDFRNLLRLVLIDCQLIILKKGPQRGSLATLPVLFLK